MAVAVTTLRGKWFEARAVLLKRAERKRGRDGGKWRGGLSAYKNKQRIPCDEQDTNNSTPNPKLTTQYTHSNQWHIEAKVPELQAEHVEDDVAPVTAEYVPAKSERWRVWVSQFKDQRLGQLTKERRWGREHVSH